MKIEWALPDQLVYATVSALLRVAGLHEQYREVIINAIIEFSDRIVSKLISAEGK